MWFVLDVVSTLDLGAIERKVQSKDARGTRPYSPRMMTALLLYGYATGVFSSRKLERGTYENVALRVLAGGEHPDFTTLSEFRRRNQAELAGLFLQVLRLCRKAGLVSLGHVSLDGTKVQANASKHKAMSYARMTEKEAALAREVADLLAKAEGEDAQDDAVLGVGENPPDIPAELQRREERLARIREAKAALEKEAREVRAATLRDRAKEHEAQAKSSTDATERKRAATRAAKCAAEAERLKPTSSDDEDEPPGPNADLPKHRVLPTPDGEPSASSQRNFTDADSRIMVRDGAFLQSYNAQIVVDERAQIILAEAVTNQAPDAEHFGPMIARTMANTGQAPARLSADAGYFAAENIALCEAQGIDPFVPPNRVRKEGAPCTNEAKNAMRTKLQSAGARATYARRKAIVEPVFGQIKEAMRFRRFSLRGLGGARFEWTFVCLVHNLKKLFRARGTLAAA